MGGFNIILHSYNSRLIRRKNHSQLPYSVRAWHILHRVPWALNEPEIECSVVCPMIHGVKIILLGYGDKWGHA